MSQIKYNKQKFKKKLSKFKKITINNKIYHFIWHHSQIS